MKRWANRLRSLLSMRDHRRRTVAWVIGALALLTMIRLGYSYPWTGFGAYIGQKSYKTEYVHQKTLWDWMQLTLVPFVVAFSVWGLNRRREDLTRELEEARTREERLQNYFDRMTELMLDKGLRGSESGAEVRDIARAWTLTILRSLDGERKVALLRFLFEASLIARDEPVIILDRADFHGAHLRGADLHGADLHGAHLEVANLTRADLHGADLEGADLRLADLHGAHLRGAHLRGAHLEGAYLIGADLIKADLTFAHLEGAHLEEADLRGAHLEGTDLRGAHLGEADLRGADLRNVRNLTREQLESARGDEATT